MKRRSLFDNNMVVGLISVVLGFLLWAVVSASANSQGNGFATTTQVLHNIPVVVLTSPQMMATSQSPVRVNLSVSGGIFNVASVQADATNIRAVANATTMGPGTHQVPIIVENAPTNAVSFVPETPYAEVRIQARVASPFHLKVTVSGKPAVGLRLGQPIASVKSVVVSGPDSLVHKVAAVDAKVDVTGSTDSVTRMVPTLPVDSAGKVVQGVFCNPETVTLSVPILSPVHQVELVPNVVGEPGAKWSVAKVTVQPASISVVGEPNLKLPEFLTLPAVSVAGMKHSRTFIIAVPPPFSGAKLSSPFAQVKVELAAKAATLMGGIPIQIVGDLNGYQYTIKGSPFVRVTVTGVKSRLASFQNQDITAYVDVSGVKAGKPVEVPITVTVPNFLIAAKVTPVRVAVEATKSAG